MNVKSCILTLMTLSSLVESYEILMILPLGPKSDKTIFSSLAFDLGMKGHNVSIVSMYGRHGNQSSLPYTDIEITDASALIKNIASEFNSNMLLQKRVTVEILKKTIKSQPEHCQLFLRDPAIHKLWTLKPDLIILPSFMNECGLIFVHKFQAPFIYITTLGLASLSETDLIENSQHPASTLNHYFPYYSDLTLWQLVYSTIVRLLAPSFRRLFVLERLDIVAKRFLSEPTVSLQIVEENVSLILVNTHYSLGLITPVQSNVIEVGGLHCRRAETVSDSQLMKFLDKSEDNSVILFSLGSLVDSSNMPDSFNKLLIDVFSKLPFKVIWKWEGTLVRNLPLNILMMPWIPQQDLLGHPAIGGFFTQGGLLSIHEAVYHGVPMVILPLMFDQQFNAKHAETMGYAIVLDLETLTEEAIVGPLNRVMKESFFRENVNKISHLMKDQITKPADRATYYIEYVIRHKGAKHLRSGSDSLSFVQLILADVSILIALIFILFLVIFIGALVMLLNVAKLFYRWSKLLYNLLFVRELN